jgi:hypothetical protein
MTALWMFKCKLFGELGCLFVILQCFSNDLQLIMWLFNYLIASLLTIKVNITTSLIVSKNLSNILKADLIVIYWEEYKDIGHLQAKISLILTCR